VDADKFVIVGVEGSEIVNVWLVLDPPPGVGVITVTCALPAAARSAAGIVAVSCVRLT